MKLHQLIVAITLAFAGGVSYTQNKPNYHDPANCRWNDGRDMSAADCEFFRKRKAEDEAEQTRYLKYEQERRQQWLQEQEALQRKADERKAREAELAAAAKRKIEQDLAEQRKAVEESRIQHERQEAIRAKKCGKDYGKLRIGMTLDRYEACTEAVDYVTERVSSAGTVEVYRGMFYYIESREGKIVAFTRR